MSLDELWRLTVVELTRLIADGELSATEVTSSFLNRIETLESKTAEKRLNAFLHVDAEGALAQAAMIDRSRKNGDRLGPLAGVPFVLKDNLCTRGVPTTCASKILEQYVPPYDAHVVQRLRAEGAVILGKTNMDEFAMGSSTENSAFGPVRNPWDLERVPGGSSGGSAAAVAAGLATAALGSDTGGSVRQPAAFCGLTAIKPTYGRVSRFGLVAFASSLDQVGPMCNSVRDAARVLGVIAGHDPRDATSVNRESETYEDECGRDVAGLRVGFVPPQLFTKGEPLEMDIADFIQWKKAFTKLGCNLVDNVGLLTAANAGLAVYYIVAPAEASSNLARFDGIRYGLRVEGSTLAETYARTRTQGFGREVKRRIMLGTYALAAGYYDAFYLRAQKVRTLIKQEFEKAFERCDVIVTPTTPGAAFKLGDRTENPLAMYMSDVFTLPASLAGLPALSTPCGFSQDGLPMGIQLVGRAFEERTLFRLASALEKEFAVVGRRPPSYGGSSKEMRG